MYVPAHAREERVPVLHNAIEAIRFGSLVTAAGGSPLVSHLPMMIEAGGELGTIAGHVARGNPQARTMPGSEAVAAFVGESFYVTPSWYASKRTTGKVVPTYNYIAVEARGSIVFFDDPARLRALVDRLTARQEAALENPWSADDAPAEYIAAQLRGFVGFELTLTAIVGAWKLNRNKDAADRAGVADGIAQSDDGRLRALADAVRAGR